MKLTMGWYLFTVQLYNELEGEEMTAYVKKDKVTIL